MQTIESVTCPFCGTLCDDLEVVVDEGRIVDVKNACVLGKATYLHHEGGLATPRVYGEPAQLEECLQKAAEILAKANYPLIYGLASTESRAQRKAVELADLIGANIDQTSSICHGPSAQAIQTVGVPSCTVGEVKNRADLVLFWGCNPTEAHPRHPSRYSVTAKGLFTARGKKDRTVVHVDVRPTSSTRMADVFLQIKPNSDYEVLSALSALLKGHTLDVAEVGGVPVEEWQALLEMIKNAKFGILYWGMGITMTRGKYLNVVAMLRFAQELNRFTKFLAAPMRGHGNVVGSAKVLTWQTGYPFGVNLSRGYPRYNPGEFTVVELLTRREVDAALIVASDPIAHLPAPAAEHLKAIPVIAIDPKESDTTKIAEVVIPTAQAGISAEGIAYRMDHVPLPLKKVVDSPYPPDTEVLADLIERIPAVKLGFQRSRGASR
ncbi:MAG: formylmethanofuran dehydrogenase subunit B [Candidatus Methylomirabilales bacterium]